MTGDAPRQGTRLARELLKHGRPAPPPRPKRLVRSFKWLDPRSLWRSRNDTIARLVHDPTDDLRRQWITAIRAQTPGADLRIADGADRARTAFAVVGDPGEGDWSQHAVVGPLLALQDRCDFLVICSDVIYPAGDINDYADKFYAPYEGWKKPIYALPGNHDWYDELQGFMYHFCGLSKPASEAPRPLLWRRPRTWNARSERMRRDRPAQRGGFQPAPYFSIDAGPITLVCIDTGITGGLDRDQGEWLCRVSAQDPKPKVLLTGKPLVVDGRYLPGVIAGQDRTVDDVVRDPAHGYVAAIGGDIHNYQRYPAGTQERPFQYVVTGGGGAFMHATHRIGPVDLGRLREDDFRCFPLRGDSLRFYAQAIVPALWRLAKLATAILAALLVAAVGVAVGAIAITDSTAWGLVIAAVLCGPPLGVAVALWNIVRASGAFHARRLRKVTLTPQQASAYVSEIMNIAPTFTEPVELTPQQRELAEFVQPRGHGARGALHRYFSEAFDIDTPPLYKQLLLVEADEQAVELTCVAALGVEPLPEGWETPLIEDRVRIPLAGAVQEMAAARGIAQ